VVWNQKFIRNNPGTFQQTMMEETMSRVIHFELPADDLERAIAFYKKTFSWNFKKWDGPMEYWLITTGPADQPGIDGGMGRRSDPSTRTENTIGVDSVDGILAKIKANGGHVIRPKSPVPGVGWMAYCKDTEGNTFDLMEEDPSAA
jgi:predicted enzyme related to lactoylglutathione lyase